MTRIQFIFYGLFLLLISLFSGIGQIDESVEIFAAAILVVLVGIPHGAVDHVLFLDGKKVNPFLFYGAYLGLILTNIAFWIWLPVFSLVFFLLNSAVHFGQSQFSDFTEIPGKISLVLNAAWGASILLGLISYHFTEISAVVNQTPDLLSFGLLLDQKILSLLLVLSTLTAVLLMVYSAVIKKIPFEKLLLEMIILGLIHASFFLLPLLIGFTLYFVLLHSLKVLVEEFKYLRFKKSGLSVFGFIRMLAPFTSLSIFFGAVVVLMVYFGMLQVSYALIFLVLLSAITLPHSIVMDQFYKSGFLKIR